MPNAPESFVFSVVPETDAAEAFAFHRRVTANDSNLAMRSDRQIRQFAELNHLFGVRSTHTGELVGLCYLAPEGGSWELGGIAVKDNYRHLGIAGVLTSFAVGSVMAYTEPWKYGQEVIAHVHEENEKPRPLLGKIGFEFIERRTFPGKEAPAGLKRNANGDVVGDIFRLTPDGLRRVCCWIHDFKGTLPKGAIATFVLGLNSLDDLKNALSAQARKHVKACAAACRRG
jgi:ribosomal protein S18 acetylase RimI-like enzyme